MDIMGIGVLFQPWTNAFFPTCDILVTSDNLLIDATSAGMTTMPTGFILGLDMTLNEQILCNC